ncbi:hypothetical protein O6H91_10G021600 [Diphasiastrum complanatum]|uniref:Uncharacterized protein n=1 Tax=Diphasiastrum complanatum TaxID=34168 RepID=A0ACC2CF19_DIPCM|nr:hypothetical protein O6H91_10G021600 [Diphasiastrum complanatum]
MEKPKFEFVGMVGGLLYANSKSIMVYEKLFIWLTSDSEVVIDAYTGGLLGRACITKRRHVISLVDSPTHIGFLRSFYSEVRNHSRVVQRRCLSLSSMGSSSVDMIPNLPTLLSSISQPEDPFSIDSDNEVVVNTGIEDVFDEGGPSVVHDEQINSVDPIMNREQDLDKNEDP